MNKTVSFKTAKRLYDLGVRIESEKAYYENFDSALYEYEAAAVFKKPIFIFPAPDAQELLDRMPLTLSKDKESDYYTVFNMELEDGLIPDTKEYRVEYICESGDLMHYHNENFAQALGLMLIWLLTNGYVTVEQINKGE